MDQSLVMTKNGILPVGVKTNFTPVQEWNELRERKGGRTTSQPDRLNVEWDRLYDRVIEGSDQTQIGKQKRIRRFLHLTGSANPKTQWLGVRRCRMMRMMKRVDEDLRVGQAVQS